MAKNRAASKHSRAARRATSPSINTDKSLKNVSLPTSSSSSSSHNRPSVLAAHHSAGVTKKSKHGRKSQLSAKAKRRQERGLELAEAIAERTSKKLEKSISKERVVQARRKTWDDVNKAVGERNGFAVLARDEGEGEDEDVDEEKAWVTDEEMDGENVPPQPIVAAAAAATAPVGGDDDDEIL